MENQKANINITTIISSAGVLLGVIGLASGLISSGFKDVNAQIMDLSKGQANTDKNVAVLQEQYKNINDKLDILIGLKSSNSLTSNKK